MAENHLDFIFMQKDGKNSQIYRVGEPELAGLLLAIDVATVKTIDAFNTAINDYLDVATGLNVLLVSNQPAEIAKTTFNHTAENAIPPTASATDSQFKPSVYFNKANDIRFGHMYLVTFNAATGAVEAPTDAATGNGGNQAEYVILSFTEAEIVTLKSINKDAAEANLASKIQLVTQSFRNLYDKIPDKTDADTRITNIINTAVADGAFPAYCNILVNIGKAYTKTTTENFDGVSVELDISYPAANAIPVIKSQQDITNPAEVKNLLNFAITCLGATETKLTGLAGGFKRRTKKSSKRRSQKKSRKIRKLRKRSNKRKGKKSRKSRRRMRKSYKK
jgi:hypothetical protein